MDNELLNNILRLKNIYQNFPFFNRTIEPIKLKKFLAELSKKIDGFGKLEPDLNLEQLALKVKKILKKELLIFLLFFLIKKLKIYLLFYLKII